MDDWVLLGLLVLFVVLAGLLVWLRRRPEPTPDRLRWKESVAEPWGTVALSVFLMWVPIDFLLRVLDLGRITPFVLAGLAVVTWNALGGLRGVREMVVDGGTVEVRTFRDRRRIEVSEVRGVSGVGTPECTSPAIWLASGEVINLPDRPGTRAVASTLRDMTTTLWVDPPTAPHVDDVPARWALGRRARRHLALDRHDVVHTLGTGPPSLSLTNRASLLRALRGQLQTQGFVLTEVLGARRSTTTESSEAARTLATESEERADEDGHWWLDDLVWRRDASWVVAVADHGGTDLSFVACGERGREALLGLERVLVAHEPSADST